MAASAPRPAEPRALASGTRLGKYEIVERIAVGGMAELYLAVAQGIEGFRKLVVLKRVSPHLQHDEELVKMFVNEARLAAALDHPNVAQVIDIGRNDGEYFFVMEYLHGRDFRQMMQMARERQGLPLECAIEVVLGVARGLHHAHERKNADGEPMGLVHRDVSPANVVITYEGSVKLVDFGIAKAAAQTRKTQAGTLMGKVGYMSPEQCMGEPVDRRSDVFALGVLLYEATTGQRAFDSESHFATMNRIIYGRWASPREVAPEFSRRLEAIIERAMASDPADRYPSAQALQLELEAYAHGKHVLHSPAVLAEYLAELYGAPPYPTIPATSPSTLVTSPSRVRAAVPILLLAAVGIVASVAATRPSDGAAGEPDTSTLGGTAPPTPAAGLEEPPPASAQSADAAALPAPAEVPPPQRPVAAGSPPRPEGVESEVEREPRAGGSDASPAKGKRSTKRKARRASKVPEPSSKIQSLYPPSYDPK